jgi:hypothetical protein
LDKVGLMISLKSHFGRLLILLLIVVTVWCSWVRAREKRRQREVVGEFASIPQFQFGLFPNHAGTGLVYAQDTEKGVGVFFCETGSGKMKLVCEQKEKGWSWQYFGMLGWSPGDGYFACAFPANDPKQPAEVILICDGATGGMVAKLAASFLLSEFTWLSPRSFACSYWDGDRHDLQVIEQKPDGNWIQARTFKQLGNKQMKGLTATSSNSVAWRQEGSIWALDFADGSPQKIWECTTNNQLVNFTYSEETKEFLLHRSDDKGQFLTRFYPPTQWTADAGRISEQTNQAIKNVIWSRQEAKYVYLGKEQGINVFYIKTGSGLVRLPWPGTVGFYRLNGDCLYACGNLTNQPLGIWEYDTHGNSLRCIVSALSAGKGQGHAQWVAPVDGVLTNRFGRQMNYHLWVPAGAVAGKKYPVVIAQTTYDWQPVPQIAANGGFYYALAERSGWYEGLDSWADDVMNLYDLLSKNPGIDTNQVFIYACSVETGMLLQLFEKHPDPWKGVLMLAPTVLPPFSGLEQSACPPTFLIIDGKEEGTNTLNGFIQYQKWAAERGIQVKLALLDGTVHQPWSVATERGRSMQIAKFLFENKN